MIKECILALAAALTLTACNSGNDHRDPQQKSKPLKENVAATTVESPDSSSGNIKVLKFSAVWCGPCKQFAPVFESIAKEYEGKADFETIDVDENGVMAQTYAVEAVPTVVITDASGRELQRFVGVPDVAELRSAIDSRLK